MYSYTNTLLTPEDRIFLKETKQNLIKMGYKRASMSKIIKYAVEELKIKEFDSIANGMRRKKII